MAPSKELDTVLEMIRVRSAEVRKTTDDDRLSYERIMSVLPMDDDIETERVGVNGTPAEWISAPESQENRVILYLHGGGYLFGSARTHRVMLAHMARASKARVLALDYRLAPEIPFPAPVEDSVSAYRWLLDQGISAKKMVIGGDSAGGGLAIAALVALRSVGEPMPAAVCLHIRLDRLGFHRPIPHNQRRVRPLGLQRTIAQESPRYTCAGKDPTAPLASPIHADLTGLPPLLLQVGSIEVLLDDSTLLKSRAKAAGVSVEMEVWDDMPHVWHHYAPILPEARKAIGRIGEFVLEHTG